ncbi:unnamed protein product [Effrenium voratum]|nr:unnamed protein product [Effrenium voratum]
MQTKRLRPSVPRIRLRHQLMALAREILAPGESLTIFGELCGGRYPHPEVKELPYTRPVQTGVWYSPSIEFLMFDITLCKSSGGFSFLPFNQVTELAQKHGLPVVPLIFVGSRGQCATHDPKFLSKVPGVLGFPDISDNFAEGIVVKPWDQSTPAEDRPIFKIKTKEFAEGGGCVPPAGDPFMREYLLSQVNENRLASAASKVGAASDRGNWQKIIDLVIDDIRDDVGGEDETFFAMENQLRCASMDLLCEQPSAF